MFDSLFELNAWLIVFCSRFLVSFYAAYPVGEGLILLMAGVDR